MYGVNSRGLAISGFGSLGTAAVLVVLNLFLMSWILFAIVSVIAALGIWMLFESTKSREQENLESKERDNCDTDEQTPEL